MDASSLYREEIYTDRRIGTIRALVPVDGNGAPDPKRPVLYVGQTQILTQAGALPLSFEIPASNLAEACAGFADGAKVAFEETMQELQEMRRQQASSIVLPPPGSAGGSRAVASSPSACALRPPPIS